MSLIFLILAIAAVVCLVVGITKKDQTLIYIGIALSLLSATLIFILKIALDNM
ncbi:MAG: hypothetical protein WCW16_05460 [Candidatus Magasanikbacteria bacterium]